MGVWEWRGVGFRRINIYVNIFLLIMQLLYIIGDPPRNVGGGENGGIPMINGDYSENKFPQLGSGK